MTVNTRKQPTQPLWVWIRRRIPVSYTHLDVYKRQGDDIPVIQGSALKALEGDSKYEDIIMDLMNTVDEYIPEPERDTDKPLLLPVEDVFSITGRGTVASGLSLIHI